MNALHWLALLVPTYCPRCGWWVDGCPHQT